MGEQRYQFDPYQANPMKKSEISVGSRYVAKVSGRLTIVRVQSIREICTIGRRCETRYDVVNLSTGRKTTFHSAAKFRCTEAASVREGIRRLQLNGECPPVVFPDGAVPSASIGTSTGCE